MYDLNIKFDYNITKKYRDINNYQCDCAYCRNYYKTFINKYPKITSFLEGFGLDINYPLEAMPEKEIPTEADKTDKTMEYTVYFPVKGEIFEDELIIRIENTNVRILKESDSKQICPSPKMEEPYLIIELNSIELPWILDEELE